MFTPAIVVLSGCHNDTASVAMVMHAPLGLLDQATSFELAVANAGGVQCDAQSGSVSGDPSGDVQRFDLERGSCKSGALWCKTITLEQDGNDRVFQVVGRGGGEAIAQGCGIAAIDQDPVEVDIQVFRFNAPRCCNDGNLQAGEQCDSGMSAPTDCSGAAGGACVSIFPDPVCECDCLSKEILVSVANDGVDGDGNSVSDDLNGDGYPDNPLAPPALTNASGSKFDLQMAFSGPSGAVANTLRAVFTDTDASSAVSVPDINHRVLSPALFPAADTGSLSKQLRLPSCNAFTAVNGRTRQQIQPAIARVSDGVVAVAFADDFAETPRFDVSVVGLSAAGCIETSLPIVRASTSEDASAEHPAIAGGPPESALVVWNQGGNVRAQIWRTDNSLTPGNADITIGSATTGTRPRVAGHDDGWIVVYQKADGDGDGVFSVSVDSGGAVSAEIKVNTATGGQQERPDVAALPDGRFAVVWASGGEIFMQRHQAGGAPLPTDQDVVISGASPPGGEPAVAASSLASGFYAVAWSVSDGTVWARYLGADGGFRFNSVTGQNDDHLASHPAIAGSRSRPSIAIGGDGFVAIGWSDSSPSHPGVYLRRFPLPE
jgi:hypothetical protein